jgi:DNA-binding NarL/FixJ family response regulator
LAEAVPAHRAKPRVLIVDEHQLLSGTIRRALEQSGVDVLAVASTADAAASVLSLGLADAVILCMRTQKAPNEPLPHFVPIPSPPTPDEKQIFRPGLTARERQVLVLLVEGASNKDVARRLAIRSNTVRTHVQNLLGKLRVHTRLEAVTLAIRGGLVEPDETIAISGNGKL